MERFISYEKLSKKEKRKMDLAKRQTWGELNPVPGSLKTARHTAETKPGIGSVSITKPVPGFLFYLEVEE